MENTTQERQILNSIAYHWNEADIAVIQFPNPAGRESSAQFNTKQRHAPASAPAVGDTATLTATTSLAKLPLEILHLILQELDVVSLGKFRLLNRYSKGAVDTVSICRDVRAFAPEALYALSATGLLSRYTVQHLFSTLCRDRCEICNDFGSFFSLLTGQRCCFTCIQKQQDLNILTVSTAAYDFALTEHALTKNLAVLTVIPGRYGNFLRQHDNRVLILERARIVNLQAAKALGISIHGTTEKMFSCVGQGMRRGSKEPKDIQILPGSTDMRPPMHRNLEEVLRSAACVPLPYLSITPSGRRTEKGLCCRGCEFSMDIMQSFNPWRIRKMRKVRDRVFSEAEFLVHFENCASARMLWDEYISKGRPLSEFSETLVLRSYYGRP